MSTNIPAAGAMVTWIDTHCHLDHERTPDGAEEALRLAREAGVERMICVGTDADRSAAAIDLASRHPDVWATVGLHPHDAVNGVEGIVHLLDAPRVVAVGECGLDYYYDHSPRAVQQEAFAAQIRLSHQHSLPLVIHTRDAWDDTLNILLAEGVPDRTIFHCFTGGPDEADRCLALGAYLSFSGIVTFKNARPVQEAAAACPPDRLLVETDSPYLAPVPHRGRPNQPALLPFVGQALADLRGTSLEATASLTRANALLAFPALGP